MSDFNDYVVILGAEVAGGKLNAKSSGTTKKTGQFRGYGQIPTRIWMGHVVPAFKGLEAEAKLIYLYLLSAPAANMAGLYYFHWQVAQIETGFSSEQIDAVRIALEQADLIAYDHATQEIWVKDFIRLQVAEYPLKADDKRTVALRRTVEQACSESLKRACLTEYSGWLGCNS